MGDKSVFLDDLSWYIFMSCCLLYNHSCCIAGPGPLRCGINLLILRPNISSAGESMLTSKVLLECSEGLVEYLPFASLFFNQRFDMFHMAFYKTITSRVPR